jgi:hypothetical protein
MCVITVSSSSVTRPDFCHVEQQKGVYYSPFSNGRAFVGDFVKRVEGVILFLAFDREIGESLNVSRVHR